MKALLTKMVVVILSLAMLLSLTACANNGNKDTESTNANSTNSETATNTETENQKETDTDTESSSKQTETQPPEPVEPPKEDFDIDYTEDDIKIDAVKEKAYDNSLTLQSNKTRYGVGKNAKGQAKVWFIATKNGMCVYAEVQDSTFFSAQTDDKIQIYVDFINDHEESGLKGEEYIVANRDIPSFNGNRLGYITVYGNGDPLIYHGFFESGEKGIAKTAYRKFEDGTGYAAEILFPMPKDGPNGKIGIGIQSQDDTNGDVQWDSVYYDAEAGADYWSDYTLLPDYTIDSKKYERDPEDMLHLKIMSHNVWNGDPGGRDKRYGEFYRKYSPDVLCLQEMAPIIRTAPMLKGLLRDYEFVDVDTHGQTNFTPILIKKGQFIVIECGFHAYSGFNDAGSKSVTWAVLEKVDSKERFGVASTHF